MFDRKGMPMVSSLTVCFVCLGSSEKSMLPFSIFMLFNENLKGVDFAFSGGFASFFSIKSEKLKRDIKEIVQDQNNSGIIIQLPLPNNFNAQEILNLIPPEKDIDVLSETSLGKFSQKTSDYHFRIFVLYIFGIVW